MNIGSLYKVKQNFWLLFPTKEIAVLDAEGVTTKAATTPDSDTAAHAARIWSRRLNCEVNYFSPDFYIVFLEEDGKYKKVLTSDGRIGWTWFDKKYNSCFEEMKVAV